MPSRHVFSATMISHVLSLLQHLPRGCFTHPVRHPRSLPGFGRCIIPRMSWSGWHLAFWQDVSLSFDQEVAVGLLFFWYLSPNLLAIGRRKPYTRHWNTRYVNVNKNRRKYDEKSQLTILPIYLHPHGLCFGHVCHALLMVFWIR